MSDRASHHRPPNGGAGKAPRSPQLFTALRGFCLGAFFDLGLELEGGADLPIALEEHAGPNRPTLYEYRPLVGSFIEQRAGRLALREDAREALSELKDEPAAGIFASAHADIAIAFASIDPHRGADGVAEARRLVSSGRVRGLKLHPPLQQFDPNDRLAYPLYEVFAEARLPVLFHTGHSGIGTGMPGGGGIRLKYGNPMPIDDVAVDFPEMPIILAHPSFPWQDEAISICLHKPTVYIDLSGWSPKYFSPTLVQYANTLLKHKVLFGSDYPLITPDRWLADLEKTTIREEVRPLILKENAVRLLGLAGA